MKKPTQSTKKGPLRPTEGPSTKFRFPKTGPSKSQLTDWAAHGLFPPGPGGRAKVPKTGKNGRVLETIDNDRGTNGKPEGYPFEKLETRPVTDDQLSLMRGVNEVEKLFGQAFMSYIHTSAPSIMRNVDIQVFVEAQAQKFYDALQATADPCWKSTKKQFQKLVYLERKRPAICLMNMKTLLREGIQIRIKRWEQKPMVFA